MQDSGRRDESHAGHPDAAAAGPDPDLNGAARMHQQRFDASPEQALAAVAGADANTDLLLDLDETLYLRNSTEDFLDCAAPGLLALLLLRLLDVLKPWRRTGGEASRDWWRLRCVRLFLPWTGWRWRRQVARRAAEHGNQPLIAAVRASAGRPVIVTAGFEPVVRPLVAALGFGEAELVAASLASPRDRLRGKLAMAEERLGRPRLAAATAVTDSLDDLPLLAQCARSLRTVWPEARYQPALGRIYLPGQYLTRIKRPGERYIVRGILQEDYAFWALASVATAAAPISHLTGLLFLLLSFWAIYERGYVDNDIVARDFERKPRLSKTFGVVEVATPAVQPWLWAAGSGAIAILLLRLPGIPQPRDFLIWAGVLAGTYLLFKAYNRLDKSTRIWLFPGLQMARAAAFVALVPIGLAASLALGAHVIARWVPYYLYRVGRGDWPDAPFFLSRLMFYGLLSLMLAMTQGHESLMTPTALVLLVWNIVRARNDLLQLLRSAHRIDRR